MPNYQALDTATHSNLRLKPQGGYSFAADQHVVSVVLHEFSRVALSYPIVFVKKQAESSFMPVALLGVEPSKNLFVDAQGSWLAGCYVPGAFRRYPFALADNGQGAFVICADLDSPFFNIEDGDRLFDEKGASMPVMDKVSEFLRDLMSSERLASAFSTQLAELDLLVPCELKVQGPDGVKVYGGSFMVDETRLANLTDEQFLSLRAQGFIAAVYCHLNSLLQLDKLLIRQQALTSTN